LQNDALDAISASHVFFSDAEANKKLDIRKIGKTVTD
jgi:hypothetical protein